VSITLSKGGSGALKACQRRSLSLKTTLSKGGTFLIFVGNFGLFQVGIVKKKGEKTK
jgi:hypothetical protein